MPTSALAQMKAHPIVSSQADTMRRATLAQRRRGAGTLRSVAPGHRSGLRSLLIPFAALLWVCRGLLRGELFFERDQLLVFLPLKRYLAERLAAGELPAWWPWDGLGQPLAALPVASAFHPSTLGYLALPFEWAFNFQTLLPFPVALLGAWYLGRTLGLRTWGAALAAALFSCGFYFVALAEQTQMHLAAMSLPWVWREAIRVARSRKVSGLGLGLATANLLLGGDPMLLELAALGTLALVLGGGAPLRAARVGRVALWAGLGVGLAAVQWVPMLHLFGESPRAAGLGIDVSDFWALRPVHLLGAVQPGAFVPETFLFESTYVGGLALALASFGALHRWRWRWPLLGILVGALILSFGRALWLWQLFSAVVPGWQGFQFPAKVLALAALALALLAGRGAVLISRRGAALPLIGAVAAGAVLSFILGAIGPGVILLLGAAVLAASAKVPRALPLVGLALTVVVTGDQLLHGATIDTQPWSELKEPPVVNALRAAGVGLDGQSYLHAWPLPTYATRLDGMRMQVQSARPSLGALWGLPSAGPYLQGYTRRVYDAVIADKDAWLSRRATLFGVSAFLVRASELRENQRAKVSFVDPSLDLAVLRAGRTMPAAYVAFGLHRVPEAQALAALTAPGFVFGRDVVLPADGPFAVPETFAQTTEHPVQPVTAVHQGDVVTIELTLSEPGVLVLNEAFTAATTASTEAGTLDCFPVNHALIGVALPPGSHRLRIARHTPGVLEGLGVTLASLLTLGLIRLRLPKRGKRQ